MWSPENVNLRNMDLVLDHSEIIKTFEPNPYTFTKIEGGKKVVANTSSFTPPSWLLLDHTIAVIWSIFRQNPPVQQLSIEDLKWAYEFLKDVKNKKGENPPDVKVCLEEIQDRLIDLYAKLTSLKDEDFKEIAAVFGNRVTENPKSEVATTSYKAESNLVSSSTKSLLHSYYSCKDVPTTKILVNTSKNSSAEDDYEDATDNEEVEKYVLSLLEDEKREQVPLKPSMIPMKKKTNQNVPPQPVLNQSSPEEVMKNEKLSKRVHCVAEMRSLKFQKSTKVTDTNGEEAAYSNLKAEIQRLTINPDVSRSEVMKFLKDWRSEQVKRLHNELKSLGNIEEFMKNLSDEEIERKTSNNSIFFE